MIAEPGKTYIGKVRAISRERDALALQLRLASVLNATDLHPPGLPASAIICIRTMRDPLPGSLSMQRGVVRPPQAWEQAVRTSLKQWVQRAAHPISGTVPANAEAVIFEDRAELLACLANDWCEGDTSSRWWWQSLFQGGDIQRFLFPAWLDAPQYVPAALQHLANNGEAVRFVQSLRDSDAHTMLERITHVFGLHELQSALMGTLAGARRNEQLRESSFDSSPLIDIPESDVDSNVLRPRYRDTSTNQFHAFTSQAAPWQSWVPESSSGGLHLDQQCLLGIGLMLLRAPTTVRTTAFAHTVLQWRETAGTSDHWVSVAMTRARDTSTTIREIPDHIMVPTHQEYPLSERTSHAPTVAADDLASITAVSPEGSSDRPLADVLEADALQHDEHSLSKQDADTPTMTSDDHDSINVEASPTGADSRAKVTAGAAPTMQRIGLPGPYIGAGLAPALAPKPAPIGKALNVNGLRGVRIETAFGGIFYLINLGLFLELYGDFTTPLQPGLHLPIWDFLALLGQCLLGEKLQTDPVWELLAQLADRSADQAPGHDFEPPDSWRVPAEWLDCFPEEKPWQWEVNNGRICVHHPARFLVLDLPLESDDALKQLTREVEAYSDLMPSVHLATLREPGDDTASLPLPAGVPTQVRHWLRWLVPYVYIRLQRALGLTDTDDLPHILCEHHAQVIATATHLDVTLSLADLPIEIRLAGLDRNPLWVPAAGRFIAFHFESGTVEL